VVPRIELRTFLLKEMQIKSTLRFYLTSVRISTIKNTKNSTCFQSCGVKGKLRHCWWECKVVQPLWKTLWSRLKKIKIELLYDPTIPLLGRYPKACKGDHNKGICTPMFIAAVFTIAKLWKQSRCPTTDKLIKKM
jgi:hypothetical protein